MLIDFRILLVLGGSDINWLLCCGLVGSVSLVFDFDLI